MFRNVSSEERGKQTKYIGSDFRKMFARQISKVQLHRWRLQNKVRKSGQIRKKGIM